MSRAAGGSCGCRGPRMDSPPPPSFSSRERSASVTSPLPAERRLAFSRRDHERFGHLRVVHSGRHLDGTRMALREQELQFRSGDVMLAGTLVLPAGDGPHPAIVVAHGSGDANRDDPFSHVLAERGFAFFRYDK